MRDHQGLFNVGRGLLYARGVLCLDDCEGTMNWETSGTGADSVCEYGTTSALFGTNGLKMSTRSTDPAENDVVLATKRFAWPASGLLVWRLRLMIPDISVVSNVQMYVYLYDGVDYHLEIMSYYPNTPNVFYTNAAGSSVPVPDMQVQIVDGVWCEFECAWDLIDKTWRYVRALGLDVDLSTVALDTTGQSTDKYVTVNIQVMAIGAAVGTCYFDSIYLGEYLSV